MEAGSTSLARLRSRSASRLRLGYAIATQPQTPSGPYLLSNYLRAPGSAALENAPKVEIGPKQDGAASRLWWLGWNKVQGTG
ncbi:7346_t:CDS:2, partial [Acaulospora colombiana]